jgi:hypothetical protein
MYNPRRVFVVLQNATARYEIPLADVDPRRWAPGGSYSFTTPVALPANAAAGDYSLSLWLPDAAAGLRDDPRYAVRFADQDIWDAATGLNVILPAFTIK